MRKLFNLLVFLFLTSLFFQCFVIFLSREHHVKYQVIKNKKTFFIEEKYQITKGKDHYLFTINGDFVFDVFIPLHKTSRLIQDIFYYEDKDISCIYPVFRTKKIKMDVLCKKEHLFYYHMVKGENKKLDAFVSSLPSYKASLFEEKKNKKKDDFVTIYPLNIPNHHYIALQNYKGIYHISNESFQKDSYYIHDIYEPKLSISRGYYFLSALYEVEDTFHELMIIRLDKNSQKKMKIPEVSISSTFHLIDDVIYLEDKQNEVIYSIDPKKRTYKKASSLPKVKTLSNYENKNYDKVEESLYYYYLYKKENDQIKVSRVYKENLNFITDLFTVPTMENIKYYDDFVYFVSGPHLYSYSDKTGLRKVLTYEELNFNKNLSYYVYKK